MKLKNIAHYATLPGVEVFATGTHNGDKYGIADLDDMVTAFGALDFKPAIKAGHTETPGMQALGYIDNLRRVGDKLVGDFVDVPDTVFEQIRNKAFNRVSSEVYWNLDRAGKTFKKALKAVALLGAEVPAVAGLKPLAACFSEIKAEVKFFDLDIEDPTDDGGSTMNEEQIKKLIEDGAKAATAALQTSFEAQLKAVTDKSAADVKTLTDKLTAETARVANLTSAQSVARIDALVASCKVAAFHPALRAFAELSVASDPAKKYKLDDKTEVSAEGALTALIAQINNKAARLFTQTSKHIDTGASGTGDGSTEVDEGDPKAISDEVDRLAKAYVAEARSKGNEVKYSAAMHTVLADPKHAELKAAYNNVHNLVRSAA